MWRPPKRTNQNALVKKLDTVFSKWVRYSAAKGKGYCKCVTCGKIEPPERCDAGHYISRTYNILRWDERNVHPQCQSCNRFKEGHKDEYALFMVRTYGAGILEELNRQKWMPYRLDDLWLIQTIKEYSHKLKSL